MTAMATVETRRHLVGTLRDASLPVAHPAALHLSEERRHALVSKADHSWCSWVRAILEQSEDHQPSLERLAVIAHTTSRTLHRRLHAEGTSFRMLLQQSRTERACALLADSDLPVSEIAYALGYTDLASFSRSFKKIKGLNPSAYRVRSRHTSSGQAGNP